MNSSIRVRVLMMQKDEGDLLGQWLSHYGGLFGIPSLHIMDNGSTDPLTLHLLQAAEAQGATIYRSFTTRHDYQARNGHFSNIIRHWDADYDYDFALPVDCDEFMAVFVRSGLTLDHQAIQTELERLLPVRCALRLDMSLFNVPGRPGWYSPDRSFHKGFLRSKSLAVLDHGSHDPVSSLAAGHYTTRLTYLHHHNCSYDQFVRKAREKLKGRVDPEDAEAMSSYARRTSVPGLHLVKTLALSEAEYLHKYDNEVCVYVPGAGATNLVSHEGVYAFWNSEAYVRDNQDVRFYELSPLHHYLRFGFPEGRVYGDIDPAKARRPPTPVTAFRSDTIPA